MKRREAVAQGLDYYNTGKPCVHGHTADRNTQRGWCVECHKAKKSKDYLARVADRRELRRLNKAARWHAYFCGETTYTPALPCYSGHLAERYVATDGCVVCHRSGNGEAIVQARRLEKEAAWVGKRAQSVNGRARKKGVAGRICRADIHAMWQRQQGRCAGSGCGCILTKRTYQIDHVLPYSLGGQNVATNIQILCAQCNWEKGKDHPAEFALAGVRGERVA